jgi:TRAP transporter TAXI family solute receptor
MTGWQNLMKSLAAFDIASAFARGGMEPGARPPARRSFVLIVIAGFLAVVFAIAGAVFVMRPATLRVAVGPAGSDDAKVIQAIAQVLSREKNNVRLRVITTATGNEAGSSVEAGTADLAVVRGDLALPKAARAVATLRKNVAAIWILPKQTAARSKGKAAPAIKTIGDLAGKRIGIIGRSGSNIALLNVILGQYGVAPEKVEIVQFGINEAAEAGRSDKIDALLAVGPVNSRITADAVAASSRATAPVFLDIDAADTIAQKQPRYESVEIPAGTFGAAPARPAESIHSIGFNHHIVARAAISETVIAAFTRQLFSNRQAIVAENPDAAGLETPDTDKDAVIPVHPGAAAYVDGEEKTFLDRYSDFIWWGLMLVSALGSIGAWFASYLRREAEAPLTTGLRDRLLDMLGDARRAETSQQLDLLQTEADQILRQTLQCYDDRVIDSAALMATDLVLQRFHDAVADRRTILADNPVRGPRGTVTQLGV